MFVHAHKHMYIAMHTYILQFPGTYVKYVVKYMLTCVHVYICSLFGFVFPMHTCIHSCVIVFYIYFIFYMVVLTVHIHTCAYVFIFHKDYLFNHQIPTINPIIFLYFVQFLGDALVIYHSNVKDSGYYQCLAENKAGWALTTARIAVRVVSKLIYEAL